MHHGVLGQVQRIPRRNIQLNNKILVIEDDRAISELLCMNLNAAGYEILNIEKTNIFLDFLSWRIFLSDSIIKIS